MRRTCEARRGKSAVRSVWNATATAAPAAAPMGSTRVSRRTISPTNASVTSAPKTCKRSATYAIAESMAAHPGRVPLPDLRSANWSSALGYKADSGLRSGSPSCEVKLSTNGWRGSKQHTLRAAPICLTRCALSDAVSLQSRTEWTGPIS